MSNYDELVQRLRASQHDNIVSGWEGDARDDRDAADAIVQLQQDLAAARALLKGLAWITPEGSLARKRIDAALAEGKP